MFLQQSKSAVTYTYKIAAFLQKIFLSPSKFQLFVKKFFGRSFLFNDLIPNQALFLIFMEDHIQGQIEAYCQLDRP